MFRWQIRISDYHLLIKYPQASEIARIEMMLADEENKRLENSLWALDFADWINQRKPCDWLTSSSFQGKVEDWKHQKETQLPPSHHGASQVVPLFNPILGTFPPNTWSGLWLQGGSWCLSTRKPKKRLLRLRRERRKRERLDSVLFYDNKWHEQTWTLYD